MEIVQLRVRRTVLIVISHHDLTPHLHDTIKTGHRISVVTHDVTNADIRGNIDIKTTVIGAVGIWGNGSTVLVGGVRFE